MQDIIKDHAYNRGIQRGILARGQDEINISHAPKGMSLPRFLLLIIAIYIMARFGLPLSDIRSILQ